MPSDPEETRTQLLDAAERLVAEHGPDGVSMREISVRADQRNHNAATYHFGSREGILEAVLDRRMGPIHEHRRVMIDQLDRDATLEQLVRVVVVPFADASRRHPSYAGFFAQLRVSGRHAHLVHHAGARTSSFGDVRDQIDRCLAHLGPAEQSRRRWLCGSLIVHAVAEFVAAPGAQPYDAWDELVDGIVDACVQVLGA